MEEFQKIKFLNDLLFSIMIFEDMNRPKLIRFVERVLFRVGLAHTTGVMQVKNTRLLSDEDSIHEAQKIILTEYESFKNIDDDDLSGIVGKILIAYNPDAYYRDEVRRIFWDIQSSSAFLEEAKFSKVKTNDSNFSNNIEKIQEEIQALTSEIDKLQKETKEDLSK